MAHLNLKEIAYTPGHGHGHFPPTDSHGQPMPARCPPERAKASLWSTMAMATAMSIAMATAMATVMGMACQQQAMAVAMALARQLIL